MRLVVDVSTLRRPATGIARFVVGLTSALRESGRNEIVEELGPSRMGQGGLIYRLPNLVLQRWWYEAGLARRAQEHGADALLGPANFAARRSSVPQVVTLHDVNFLSAPGTYEPGVIRYLMTVFRHAVRNADVLTTVSEHSRDNLIDLFAIDPALITVVYPGLSTPATPPPRPARVAPYALYVGATEFHKNVATLLDAWRDESPAGLDLVLVGQPGRAHSSIVAQAARLGGRVIVRGRAAQTELEQWYAGASVLVFPSLAEGFGYPPLEAMLRGVPVIAARAGSLPEVLGDAALFHEPRDAEQVRDLVETVMADSTTRRSLIDAGSSRARTFTWNRSAEAMEAAIAAAGVTRARKSSQPMGG